MKPCFADTYFFLALLNAKDVTHQKALAANRIKRPVVTSAWIMIELGDHLCDEQNRHLFRDLLAVLQKDVRYQIVPADQSTLDDATDLYNRRPDKSWSLTDCTSFILMGRAGLTEALTADHHFEQAGFLALFK